MIFDYKTFDPTKSNAIIEASAGTGKTFSVTEIVKKLVLNDEYKKANNKEEVANNNLKKILIVTFTEKATGELRDRIRDELEKEAVSINFDINSFNIYTIHSFCQNTINEFCVEANLPIGLSVINNEKALLNDFIDRYIREGNIFNEIEDNLCNAVEDKKVKIDTLKKRISSVLNDYYLDKNDNEIKEIVSLKNEYAKSFNETCNKYIDFKNNFEILNNSQNPFLKSYVKYIENLDDISLLLTKIPFNKYSFDDPVIQRAFIYLLGVRDKKKTDTGFNGKNISEILSSNQDLKDNYNIINNSTNFDAMLLINAINNDSKDSRLKFIYNQSICNYPGLTQDEIDAINYFDSFKSKLINKEEFDKYLTIKYLKDIYIAWQSEKLKNKQQSFGDMIKSVRENILTNDKFKKCLQDKYKYAIIDEFQDTNQLQFDVFRTIFMEDDNHKMIVVGDPKQSIYQFQGADLNVYEKAKSDIKSGMNGKVIPGIAYSLDTNWRSSEKMIEGCNSFFKDPYFNEPYDSKIEFMDSKYSGCGKTARYYNEKNKKYEDVDALWVGVTKTEESNELFPVDDNIYAEQVVKQIIDFCSFIPNTNNTKLQIRPKNVGGVEQEFRNVTFNDFTILYKARTEGEYIERILKRCGVSYIKYKDKTLFYSKECAHFIALFEAIASTDFTGFNRKKFKKALFTDFFGLNISTISDKDYDRDDSDEMNNFLSWKETAKTRKWEKLIDDILRDSNILNRLSTIEKLQSITIYKQLADYAISYLYDNHNLEDLILNLKSLSSGSEDDEDSATVEVGVELNSIKLMTIHASKGLQFPIVISIAGIKNRSINSNSYVYHDNGLRKISFESSDAKEDDVKEFKRLIYVAYTRAEYLMIIPYYQEDNKNIFKTIIHNDTLRYLEDNKNAKKLYCEETNYNLFDALKTNVKNIIDIIEANELKIKEAEDIKNKITHLTKDEQEKKLKDFSNNIFTKSSIKYAYSSLAHGKNDKNDYEEIEDDELLDKENENEDIINSYDNNKIEIFSNLDDNINPIDIPISFPKGKEIGSALHEIFEKATFTDYQNRNDNKLDPIIIDALKHYKFREPKEETLNYIREMVINVLNSNLVEIKGSNKTDNTFKLSSIKDIDKKAEREFNYNIFKDYYLFKYFNGFIDLIFRRGDYYSILDWKSDSLNDDDLLSYSDPKSLELHTNNHYAIQRVLYSYCLIRWLNKMYKEKSLEETFNKHFGGVYYVYIRGCNKDYGNGIYSQTWETFKDLREAYEEIIKKEIGGKIDEIL